MQTVEEIVTHADSLAAVRDTQHELTLHRLRSKKRGRSSYRTKRLVTLCQHITPLNKSSPIPSGVAFVLWSLGEIPRSKRRRCIHQVLACHSSPFARLRVGSPAAVTCLHLYFRLQIDFRLHEGPSKCSDDRLSLSSVTVKEI